MTSDDSDSKVSDIQKMSADKAFDTIGDILWGASIKSSFLIGLLWLPITDLIQYLMGCIQGKCGGHFSFSLHDLNFMISELLVFFVMGIGAVVFGPIIFLPSVFAGAAIWRFLLRYKVKGLLSLILVGALIAGLNGQVLKPLPAFKVINPSSGNNLDILFDLMFPLGGALTAVLAYPKLKKVEIG